MKKRLFSFLCAALLCSVQMWGFTVDGNTYAIITGTNNVEVTGSKPVNGILTIPSTVIYNNVTYNVIKMGARSSGGATTVILPSSMIIIGDNAFSNNTYLTSITIPNSVTTIEGSAFSGCSNLTSITIPNSVTTIGNSAFANTGLTSIIIPNSITTISQATFSRCIHLTSITLSNSLETIEDLAFDRCINLPSIIIPESVKSISEISFKECPSLKQIEVFWETPIEISANFFNSIFYNYSSYWGINEATIDCIIPVGAKNVYAQYSSWCSYTNLIEKGYNYWFCDNPIAYGAPKNIYWSLCPNGVLTVSGIGDMPNTDYLYGGWFVGYSKDLTSIVIENGLTSIGDYSFYDASYSNANPTSVSIPESVKKIGKYAFSQAPIVTINIPGNVEDIGESAFEMCQTLTSLTFNPGLKSIGSNAFYYCTGLASVDIPESVTYIGPGAFNDISILNDVTVHWKTPLTFPDSYGRFSGGDFTKKTLYVPKGTSEAYRKAFIWSQFGEYGKIVEMDDSPKPDFEVVNGILIKYNGAGGDVVIPDNLGITSIGYQAFLDCKTLTSVEIPKGVTSIETSAFSGCANLTSVKLPSGLLSISDRAFYNCTALTAVDIPKSVTAIGLWAFFQCPALRDVTVHWDSASDIPEVGAFLTSDIASATLHVPAGMKEAYQSAYGWEGFGTYIEDSIVVATYNPTDIEALQNFVSQNNNYQVLGLDAGWNTDPQWYEKVKGVVWTYDNNSEMRITEIDWDNYPVTGRLDAAPFSFIQTLKVSYTNLIEINASGLLHLNHLACSHIGLIRYLNINNCPMLKNLFCSHNIFSFNTLPPIESKYDVYSYAPQLTMNIFVNPGEEADLTDYLHNNNTVFKWYRQSNLFVQLGDITENNEIGKFVIPEEFADEDLVCLITNSDFPDFADDNAMRCRVHVGAKPAGAIVAEKNAEVDVDKESVDIKIEAPSGAAAVYAQMTVTVPDGIYMDLPSLEAYMAKGNYVMDKIEKTTEDFSSNWFLSFAYSWLPSIASSTSFRVIGQPMTLLNIPFIFDGTLPDGNYTVTISNITLDYNDGTRYVESDIPVTITLNRSSMGINKPVDNVANVYIRNNTLYINTPVAETVQVYSINGMLLYSFQKQEGKASYLLNQLKNAILIVRGSSGWAKKVY